MTPQRLVTTVTTLAIGLGGALLFKLVNAPVPWLLGPLVAVALVGFAGIPTALPKPLRNVGLAILGTTIGTGFRPNLIDSLIGWLPTMLAMLLVVVIIMPLAWLLYRRYAGWSTLTAALAAIPGGFATMALTAEEHGADVSKVSMAHTFRIVSIIMLMPILVQWLSIEPTAGAATVTNSAADSYRINLSDSLTLIACTLLGPWIGRKLRLPAFIILGAMLLSAFAHVSGLTQAMVPGQLIFAVQLVTGCWLGASFAGIDRRELLNMLWASLLVTFVTLLPTTAFAWLIASQFNFELLPLLLAFAPGGMPEMALIALVFDLDPMFVIGHHLVRMLVLVLAGSLLLPWFLKRQQSNRHSDRD